MQKKSKYSFEFLKTGFPENIAPRKKLTLSKKKLLWKKRKPLNFSIRKAEEFILKQYILSLMNTSFFPDIKTLSKKKKVFFIQKEHSFSLQKKKMSHRNLLVALYNQKHSLETFYDNHKKEKSILHFMEKVNEKFINTNKIFNVKKPVKNLLINRTLLFKPNSVLLLNSSGKPQLKKGSELWFFYYKFVLENTPFFSNLPFGGSKELEEKGKREKETKKTVVKELTEIPPKLNDRILFFKKFFNILKELKYKKKIKFLYSLDQLRFELGKKGLKLQKVSDFRNKLKERKKLSFFYENLSKNYFKKVYQKAKQLQGKIQENFLILLENRLDVLLYRIAFFNTRSAAKQWITHSHVLVNNQPVTIPSYQVQPGDIISIEKKKLLFFKENRKNELKSKLKIRKSRFFFSPYLLKKLKDFITQFFNEKRNHQLFDAVRKQLIHKTENFKFLLNNKKKFHNYANKNLYFKRQFLFKPFFLNVNFLSSLNRENKMKIANNITKLEQKLLLFFFKEKGSLYFGKFNAEKSKKVCEQLDRREGKKSLKKNFLLKLPSKKNKKGKSFSNKTPSLLLSNIYKKILLKFTNLILKKKLSKKRLSWSLLPAMALHSMKPLHIEVNYKVFTAILLYSPQKISFPFTLDLDLVLRNFK